MGFNIGWIDFSKEERDKALDILRLLQEKGAVDELGIGIVRDAFADTFFPGTSTLLTRAKYFVVVPYIIREKVKEGVRKSMTPKQTLELINAAERGFGVKMQEKYKGEQTAGIIGSVALSQGRWVKRSPSELYWNGIRTLGICCTQGLSLLQYIKTALECYKAKGVNLGTRKRGEADEGDDLDAGNVLGFKPLDIGNIYKKGWLTEADIALTLEEAKYLRSKILSNIGESVFAKALEENIDIMQYGGDFIAFAENMATLVDSRACNLLELACYFAHIVYAGRVRYNIMLQGNRNDEALACWDQFLQTDYPKIPRMGEVLDALPELKKSKGYVNTASFLERLADLFHSREWSKMDDLIRKREKEIKGERAKLQHQNKYPAENWIGGKYLDYRLPDAARIIADIYEGLGVVNV